MDPEAERVNRLLCLVCLLCATDALKKGATVRGAFCLVAAIVCLALAGRRG